MYTGLRLFTQVFKFWTLTVGAIFGTWIWSFSFWTNYQLKLPKGWRRLWYVHTMVILVYSMVNDNDEKATTIIFSFWEALLKVIAFTPTELLLSSRSTTITITVTSILRSLGRQCHDQYCNAMVWMKSWRCQLLPPLWSLSFPSQPSSSSTASYTGFHHISV